MKSIELVAILVAPSDFQKLFLGLLRAPEDPPGRGKSSVFDSSIPLFDLPLQQFHWTGVLFSLTLSVFILTLSFAIHRAFLLFSSRPRRSVVLRFSSSPQTCSS